MYFLVIFVYFLLSPFLALAEKEQSSFEIKDILDNGMSIIEKVLHYRIIALENQSITLENIFIGLVVFDCRIKIFCTATGFKLKIFYNLCDTML